MFSFKNYYKRWCDRYLSWHNHRYFKEDDSSVAYHSKVKMSCKISDDYQAIMDQYNNAPKIPQRQLPITPIECKKCNQTHVMPNQMIKCQFSNFAGNCSRQERPQSTAACRLQDLFLLKNKQNLINKHQIDEMVVYMDGSPDHGFQTSAYISVHGNQIKIRAFDISNLYPHTSTRAKLATITLASNDPTVAAYGGPIKLITDLKYSIEIIKEYRNGVNYRNIYSTDILEQASGAHHQMNLSG